MVGRHTDRRRAPDGGAKIDDLFAALADERRRQVLRYFQTTDATEASVADLVAFAGDESASPDDGRLAIVLHHATLPRLAEAGLVEYDPASRTVRYRAASLIERMFGVVDEVAA